MTVPGFHRDMKKDLLVVVGRDIVAAKLTIDRPCLKCGKEMSHQLSGPLMNGYEYGLLPCGWCGARHQVVIRPKGYELKLRR